MKYQLIRCGEIYITINVPKSVQKKKILNQNFNKLYFSKNIKPI